MIKSLFTALKQFLMEYAEYRAKNLKNRNIGY